MAFFLLILILKQGIITNLIIKIGEMKMCVFCKTLNKRIVYIKDNFKKLTNQDKKICFSSLASLDLIPRANRNSFNYIELTMMTANSIPCSTASSKFNFLSENLSDYINHDYKGNPSEGTILVDKEIIRKAESDLIRSERFQLIVEGKSDFISTDEKIRLISSHLSYFVEIENDTNSLISKHQESLKNEVVYKKPSEIEKESKEYVKGQDESLKILSLVFHQQLHKSKGLLKSPQKLNSIILGDSGSGKTHIIKTLAKVVGLPHVVIPVTSVTQEGWSGGNIGEYLGQLYKKDKGDFGIVFFDEIDKISSYHGDSQISSHNLSLQNELLTIVEGQEYGTKEDDSSLNEQNLYYNSENMLFIFGGSFDHQFEISSKAGVGFEADVTTEGNRDEFYKNLKKKDLLKFGIKKELLGRIQCFSKLKKLTKEDYLEILFAKEGMLDYYVQYFRGYNTTISFEQPFLDEVIDQHDYLFGARSLSDTLFMRLQGHLALFAEKNEDPNYYKHMNITGCSETDTKDDNLKIITKAEFHAHFDDEVSFNVVKENQILEKTIKELKGHEILFAKYILDLKSRDRFDDNSLDAFQHVDEFQNFDNDNSSFNHEDQLPLDLDLFPFDENDILIKTDDEDEDEDDNETISFSL